MDIGFVGNCNKFIDKGYESGSKDIDEGRTALGVVKRLGVNFVDGFIFSVFVIGATAIMVSSVQQHKARKELKESDC